MELVLDKVKNGSDKLNKRVGGVGMKFKASQTNDDLVIRENRQYRVWTEKVGNREYQFIINDASIRIPLKKLSPYIELGILVETEDKQ